MTEEPHLTAKRNSRNQLRHRPQAFSATVGTAVFALSCGKIGERWARSNEEATIIREPHVGHLDGVALPRPILPGLHNANE
jgi:hypothetical protein